jgi:DNA-binding transcriptional ArsR family regulator
MNVTQMSKDLINKEDLEKAAFILKTVAHPMRLAIINILSKEEMQVLFCIEHCNLSRF